MFSPMPRVRVKTSTSRSPARAPRPAAADPRFEQDTGRHVARMRQLLAQLVDSLPARPASASDFQRATRLDMKLCWKVFRVINAPDGLSGAQYIPGPANMRDLLKTMSRLGAPDALIRKIEAASLAFESLVDSHAGDRRTFDSMVSGFGQAESDKVDSRERKAAFRAATHVWGVQAEAVVMTMIQRPAASDPLRLDEIGLRGEFGLRRLRPTRLPLFEQSHATHDKHGLEYSGGRRRPLSAAHARSPGVGLIEEFCTAPLDQVRLRQLADGRSIATLDHPELGKKARVDVVAGFALCPGMPRYRGEETHAWSVAHIAKPCRVVVIDVIQEIGTLPVPPPLRGFMTTKNSMTSHPEELWSSGQLSDGESVMRLGFGADVLAMPEVPRYPELIDWAIRKAGWNPDRFETWRLRVEYPITLSSVGAVYDMPDAPR
jgi:hypothetical protein